MIKKIVFPACIIYHLYLATLRGVTHIKHNVRLVKYMMRDEGLQQRSTCFLCSQCPTTPQGRKVGQIATEPLKS